MPPAPAPQDSTAGASPPAAREPAPASSGPTGLDVAELRRVWPNVLGRIFTMRRATWTFLSQHAQVIDYDGSRLVLGIATIGLANTFRQGNHAELVRQALIDEIGLDVRVEGVSKPPPGVSPDRALNESPPRQAPVDPTQQESPGQRSHDWPDAEVNTDEVPPDEGPPPPEDLPPADLDAAYSTPHAAASTPSRVVRDELARAAAVKRNATTEPPDRAQPSLGAGGSAPPRRQASAPQGVSPAPEGEGGRTAAPDDVVSLDDEDVVDGAQIGQAVIERVLGARVVEETSD